MFDKRSPSCQKTQLTSDKIIVIFRSLEITASGYPLSLRTTNYNRIKAGLPTVIYLKKQADVRFYWASARGKRFFNLQYVLPHKTNVLEVTPIFDKFDCSKLQVFMAKMENPHYNPYPEPPPAYTMGFGQPDPANFDPVTARAAVNTAIHLHGRNPVNVVCPTCRNSVMTSTLQFVSPVFDGTPVRRYYTFGGTLLIICIVFIVLRILTGSYIPLIILPVFVLFLLMGLGGWRYRQRTTAVLYSDVHHSCPVCKTKLGVSNGLQYYQMRSNGMQAHVHDDNQRF